MLCTGTAEHYRANIHGELKLVLVRDSGFEVRRRGTIFRAGAGQLIALHADDTHSGGPLDGQPTWALMCLPPSRLDDGVSGPLSFGDPCVGDLRIADAYLRLHRLLDSSAATLRKDEATLRFVATLRHAGGSVRPSDNGPAPDDRIRSARDYLADQLARNVSLDELAGVAGLSKYHLVRAFTREFGLPPHTMHLRLRLDRAQSMLRRGRRSAEVAQATGFADQAHLSQSFQRTYGLTPGQYRANCMTSTGSDPATAGPGLDEAGR